MKEKKKASFYRVYKGLMMGFDLPQAVFMVYMSDLMAKEFGIRYRMQSGGAHGTVGHSDQDVQQMCRAERTHGAARTDSRARKV